MKTSKLKTGTMLTGIVAACAVWILSGCLIGSGQGGDGPAFTSSDSASFLIQFNKPPYTGGDSLNVAKIRKNLHEQGSGIKDSNIQITNLAVTFDLDDSTRSFLFANAGVRFSLMVYYQDSLALSTDTANLLAFDSTHVDYELRKNGLQGEIYGSPAGFHKLTHAIQDTTVNMARLRAEVVLKDPLVRHGRIKANCVLTATATGIAN